MKFTDYYKKEDIEKEDFEFEVSYLITELRLKFGLTQAELAKKIGTKQPSIARMESGAELPSLRILKKIADSLKVGLIPPRFGLVSEGTIKTKSFSEGVVSDYCELTVVFKSSKTEIANQEISNKVLSAINN
jgi:transcriptional regulator with XRE-family HTH domain